VADTQTGIEHDVIARILDVLAERNILGAHIHHLDTILRLDALKLTVEIGVLQIVEHFLAASKEAHTRIGNLHEFGLRDGLHLLLLLFGGTALLELVGELLNGLLGILWLEELKGTVLGKVILVPVLYNSKLLVVRHHVIARNNGVKLGGLDQLDELRSGKDHVGINGNKDIIGLAVKGLLVLATTNIETEGLHTSKGNKGALARADDDVITIGRDQNMKRLSPGKHKSLAKVIAWKSDDDTGLLLLGLGLLIGGGNDLIGFGHFYDGKETNL